MLADARPAPAAPIPAPRTRFLRADVVAALLLAVALLARLPKNGQPPLGPHDFRQTQTAITVQAWLDRGFTLAYETPVFGPPGRVPFELPTYQATAWVLAKAGVKLDRALHLAAIAWFLASAVLLYALARRFAGERAALATLALYVLSPFSLLWGRAVLIEYAAVALALGWLLAVLAWVDRPRAGVAVLAAALGALAATTKITTIPIVVPGLVLAALAALRRARRDGRSVAATLAVLVAVAAVPLAATALWTRSCDAVKAASPATAWLVSGALGGWNFGSMAQRLTYGAWAEILGRVQFILPGILPLLLGPTLGTLWRRRGAVAWATGAALAGAILPVLVFFNLYVVHDYYLSAITPCLALLAGIGAAEVLAIEVPWRSVALEVAAAAVVATSWGAYAYAAPALSNTRRWPIVRLAEKVKEVTPADGWVVIQGDDWSPRIPYLAGRRAFMVKPPVVGVELAAGRPEYTTLVCAACTPELLAHWASHELVTTEAGFSVYRIRATARAAARLDGRPAIP